jgi:hypothetical protein
MSLRQLATGCYLEAAAPLDILEHVPAWGIFHGNGEVGRREEDLLELDDMRVAKVAVADDLPLHMLCDLIAALQASKCWCKI